LDAQRDIGWCEIFVVII